VVIGWRRGPSDGSLVHPPGVQNWGGGLEGRWGIRVNFKVPFVLPAKGSSKVGWPGDTQVVGELKVIQCQVPTTRVFSSKGREDPSRSLMGDK